MLIGERKDGTKEVGKVKEEIGEEVEEEKGGETDGKGGEKEEQKYYFSYLWEYGLNASVVS